MQIINFKHFAKTWCISTISTTITKDISTKTLHSLRECVALLQHCNSTADFMPDYIPRWVLEEMLKVACCDPEKHLDVIVEIMNQLSSRGE